MNVQDPVVLKSMMYQFEDKNEYKMYEHLLQLLHFLILIPFLLQRQETHPKNMHFNDHTVIMFYNSNYTLFYHLG